MSAKEFYHKNVPVHRPHLPPELWTTIIQHATWVPGGYDPDLTTLALGVSAATINKEQLLLWKKALVTKRAIALVCKAWYFLTAPFLYEYIHLGRGRAVLPLLQGIYRSKVFAQRNDKACPLGWWTKRIDVNLRDSSDNPRADINAVGSILGCLPNLRVLTFSITGHKYTKNLSPAVLWSVSCRNTLRFVHFYNTCLPSADVWTLFLAKHPYLVSANFNEISKPRDTALTLDCIQVVHIHALYPIDFMVKENIRNLWDGELPSVRSAIYELEFSNNDDLPVGDFFTKLGPQLTTLQITQIYPVSDLEVEAALQVTFTWIFLHCHALEQINLIFYNWSMLTLFDPVPRLPSKVTTLVIRVTKGQLSRQIATELFYEMFVALKSKNPNLKTIQFVSAINVRGLRTHPVALASGLQAMSDVGVVVKDEQGHAMM